MLWPLKAEEEQAIDLKRELIAGQERVAWNPALSIPAKDFDLTEAELPRIRVALESWATFGAALDRRWLEPLLRAFIQPSSDRVA